MLNIGLIGYGKAGQAVANVLLQDARYRLRWVLQKSMPDRPHLVGHDDVLLWSAKGLDLAEWLDNNPVDVLVDFSTAQTAGWYADEVRKRGLMLVTAISNYDANQTSQLQQLGLHARVLCSPNITLGINFLLLSAKLLRQIAPFADVEVVEQHFREKPEVSGTAKKIAATLGVDDEHITSLRLGGVVGHHEVIFGFPHQTVRLVHDSIRREAFGTGVAYAIEELAKCENGFYVFEDLLMNSIQNHLRTT